MSIIVRRAINDVKPEMFLMMETELWPNFIGYLHKVGIPIALVNGRISQRSFKGYMLIRWLISGTLKKIGLFCMQTEPDAQRIIAMGAPRDRVKVTGNMKFDIPGEEDKDEGKKSLLRNYLKLANGDELFVAGSTHKGEDEIILRTYKRLADRHNHLRLLIAPRHLERLGHIERLTQRSGFVPARFSQMQDDKGSNVILLDTIGQLKWIYSAATIVFIGGSLVPCGGHNMIEPASLEKPLLFGPHVFNFQEVANVLLNRKGAILVKDEKELIESCERLLSSSEERLKMGRRAKESISENRGATSRNVHLIASSLLTG
jgi:3-deoxy-D-manno-octulosonic-acid transferase